jgi:asparaginyl-tRNA synthetase
MSTSDRIDVASILKGEVPVGTVVTVRGWVRTRRDSKAGLSFVHLHDGSGFDPLQVVCPAALSNYESELKRRSAS